MLSTKRVVRVENQPLAIPPDEADNLTGPTQEGLRTSEIRYRRKEDGETEGPVYESPVREPVTSLFMRDGREGQRGDAQDEKDETAE
jgi:hypothetical protein